MANIVSISVDDGLKKQNTKILTKTFKELNLNESQIEEYIRLNIDEIIDEDDKSLLIVGQQVQNKENGRSDLTAIDEDGNIVLIEVKRDLGDIKSRKEAFEFQAIRYAASNAKIKSIEELADKIYTPYIEKYNDEHKLGQFTSNEFAIKKIKKFLSDNESLSDFNSKQRIILIASEFDNQTLSATSWLNESGIDITCLKMQPIEIDGNIFLNTDKILPTPKPEDFYVDIKSKSSNVKDTSKSNITRTKLPKMDKLFEWGVLKDGDNIYIKGTDKDDSKAIVKNSKYVDYKGKEITFNEWGQSVKEWDTICIYKFAVKEDCDKTLDELRQEKMKQD